MNTAACGTTIPCASFYSQNPFQIALNTAYTFPFTITTGYNQLFLNQPVYVTKGSFLLLTQTVGKVAIDSTSINTSYSDMAFINNAYYNLSLTSNWRFYLKSISNYSTYQSLLVLNHQYANPGLYNITFTFNSSNDVFQYLANITQCEFVDLLIFNFLF